MLQELLSVGHLSTSDFVTIFTVMGGVFAFVSTVVVSALKLQRFITSEFEQHRKQMYRQLEQRDRAIRRIEYWAIKQNTGYQPGVDPIEFRNSH